MAPLFKINVDGLVFAPQRVVVVGVIVCNEEGEVIAALSKKIKVPLGALEADAKAFEVGLQFTQDIGVSEYCLEGDL